MLVQNKVFANESLMFTHLSSFILLTIFSTAICILVIAIAGVEQNEMSLQQKRIYYAITILRYF